MASPRFVLLLLLLVARDGAGSPYKSLLDQMGSREHTYHYIALMNFFGSVDTPSSLPARDLLNPRADDRSLRLCRTIGDFAVYMHDFGLEHFDVNFRKDGRCWNGTDIAQCNAPIAGVERGYTWWCNKRPNNPCVFNCPTQVEECSSATPRPLQMDWQSGSLNTLPRWPNTSMWMSAWEVHDPGMNQTHIIDYYIPNGWGTNLVTSYWPLNQKDSRGIDLYAGDYWFQGAKRVQYSMLTVEPGEFVVPGVPDGRENAMNAYLNSIANERHYWSHNPTNETITHTTKFRVWGQFSTYTTHLSNHEDIINCHATNTCESNVTAHSRGTLNTGNMMQCPFQFRCFSPESVAGSPGCHRFFPNDFTADSNSSSPVHAPPNIRSCIESCPGCSSCAMIQCWRDENNVSDRAWNATRFVNESALQDDRVPYLRVRHYDEGFGNWHDSRVEPFGWYVNLNGSGLDTSKSGQPKLQEWWNHAMKGSYHTSWLYHLKSWRDVFLTNSPDPAFFWHNNSWRVQACAQHKLVWMSPNSPFYNVLNISYAGGWSNYTQSWSGNTGYPSRRFATWLESPHYQGCYLTPGGVPIHRPPGLHDRLDGFPKKSVPEGYLPPGDQDQSLSELFFGYQTTYEDSATMPCTFPSLPIAKLVDELVFLTELEEFSFTDFAFIDFLDTRRDWKQNGILTSQQYTASLGRNPQSLNDFKNSCFRLEMLDKLHNMTLQQCESRRAQFASSMKVFRINATAPQTPYLSGAILNGDRGVLNENSSTRGVYGFYNTWISPVVGTLPPEWGEVFPNMQIIDLGVADKMLGFTNRIVNETLQGSIPSSWANMTALWYLNLHQQIGLCAWSNEDTPFNIHFLAARDNTRWYINMTANQDWTVQRSALSRDDLRGTWGAKRPVWDSWKPLDGPFSVRDNTGALDDRTVLQIFTPYNMTRLPFNCLPGSRGSKFMRLPEEMMTWPVYEETCLKYANTDASTWGLESCWTQWPRDNSWENPYLHFKWSTADNYTYSDQNIVVMTLATSTYGYYEPFVQRTFHNMSYYGWPSETDQRLDWWQSKSFADWSATPWSPTFFSTSYNRSASWDWAWRYTGSFWYSNFHFPMVTEMVQNGDYTQGTIRGRHHWGNNQCMGKCGGLVYNNHIFVDWRDRRLGNGSFNYSASSFQAAAINGTIQSLPDFDNPCERIWHRYFSTTTSHLTWFTRRHNVSKNVMINDCERSVADWQKSLMQIRIIRNVTKPVSSHNIQASYPSNLDTMNDAYQMEDLFQSETYPGRLNQSIHYDGQTKNGLEFWLQDPSAHSFFNPPTGSLLTRVANWPESIAQALGVERAPSLALLDPAWWSDMDWYMDPVKNATHPPRDKIVPGQRYWEWDARYPSTYPKYVAPWPSTNWSLSTWPAHLYGTLPSFWGELNADGQANLPSLRIIDLHDLLRTGKLTGYIPKSWLDNLHDLSLVNLYGHREICNNMEHNRTLSIQEYVKGRRGRQGGPPDWAVNDESYFYWETRFDVKWNNVSRMAAESCLYNSLDVCYVGYPSQRNDTYPPFSVSFGFNETLPQVLVKPNMTLQGKPDPYYFTGPIIYPYQFDPWLPVNSPGYSSNVSVNPAWAWGEFFEGYNFWLHVPWTKTNPSVHHRDTFSSVSFLGASRMYDATGDPEAIWLPRRMRRLWILLDPWTNTCCTENNDCASGSCTNSVCQPPSCEDGIKNGLEVDVDCGGGCKCEAGRNCTASSNCKSNVCSMGLCQVANCTDGQQNGDETGQDCGGSCSNKCPTGFACNDDTDCISGHCFIGVNYTCAQPTCVDKRKNGNESDIDCGGVSCLRCDPLAACTQSSDCWSNNCENGTCAYATCSDGILNGNETDVDCGGEQCVECGLQHVCNNDRDCWNSTLVLTYCRINGTAKQCTQLSESCMNGVVDGGETDIDCGGPCPKCHSGLMCDMNRNGLDCSSGVCTAGVCCFPACNDTVQNGDETDVDCGGSCRPCLDNKLCKVGVDCLNNVCAVHCAASNCTLPMCAPASCDDLTHNGLESDLDCGGNCSSCATGKHCSISTDCQSNYCHSNTCQEPTCSDGARNGEETDVDCGGQCLLCADGLHCTTNGDCQSKSCTSSICVAPTCIDGFRNGNETDIDCGGESCVKCSELRSCRTSNDCQSRVCKYGVCRKARCDDGVKNGLESDIDCGGPCPKCPNLYDCLINADCQSGVCYNGFCSATCVDGVKNAEESDVDCGGGICPPCTTTLRCTSSLDCLSGSCLGYTCAPPMCSDGLHNGNETDIDCGGNKCGGCLNGFQCDNGLDCQNKICAQNHTCAAATCSDGVLNGVETDQDCGGGCEPCPHSSACRVGGDCRSGICHEYRCSVPTCHDATANGNETDIDCGGPCSPCPDYMNCRDASDCLGNNCFNNTCRCGDGLRNGNESDIDCGGGCGTCATNQLCASSEDCTSTFCHPTHQTCQPPTCDDGFLNGAEVDLDCGGPCPLCPPGAHCTNHLDCSSDVCSNQVCVLPTCWDGKENGHETSVDCGGEACPKCADGSTCNTASDCVSLSCSNGTCTSSCDDGMLNGEESDVDCGGRCTPCLDGKHCKLGVDCTNSVCRDTLCAAPTCQDGVTNGDETFTDCGNTCDPIQLGITSSNLTNLLSPYRIALNDYTKEACVHHSCVIRAQIMKGSALTTIDYALAADATILDFSGLKPVLPERIDFSVVYNAKGECVGFGTSVIVDTEPPRITCVFQQSSGETSAIIRFNEQVEVNTSKFEAYGMNMTVQLQNHSVVVLGLIRNSGNTPILSIPGSSYKDFACNWGESFVMSVPFYPEDMIAVSRTLSIQYTANLVAVSTTAVGGVSFLIGSGFALVQGALAKSNLLRAGYHYQMLAMTANLAIPRLPDAYKTIVKQLGWSTLKSQGLQHFGAVGHANPTRRLMESHKSDTQYMLVVSTVTIGVVLVLHFIVNTALRRFKKTIPIMLRMPCAEILLMGFIFVALSFYASIPIGINAPADVINPRTWLIHLTICLPYFIILLFLAVRHAHASGASLPNPATRASSNNSSEGSWYRGPHWFKFTGPVLEDEAASHPFARSSLELPHNPQLRPWSKSEPGAIGEPAEPHHRSGAASDPGTSAAELIHGSHRNLVTRPSGVLVATVCDASLPSIETSKLEYMEYMWSDITRDSSGASTIAQTTVFAWNFAHKALLAFLLGYFSQSSNGILQVMLSAAAQMCFLAYLVAVKPFQDVGLLMLEIACHALELLLLWCAFAILYASPRAVICLTWTMIACALAVISSLFLFELRRLAVVLKPYIVRFVTFAHASFLNRRIV